MIITITHVEEAYAKSGAKYVKVKGISEGKEVTKSVFDNLKDSWKLLEVGATLNFKMEQKGQFWNVVGIEPVTTTPQEEPRHPSERTSIKGTVFSDTVDNKNKSYALSYAKDMAVSGIIKRDEIISWAKAFEAFLNGLLVVKDDDTFREALKHCNLKTKNPLVEEAKKLGATEIEEELGELH